MKRPKCEFHGEMSHRFLIRGKLAMTGRIFAVYEQGLSEEHPEAFLTRTHAGRSKTCQNKPNRPWQRPLITPELGRISESHSEVK